MSNQPSAGLLLFLVLGMPLLVLLFDAILP